MTLPRQTPAARRPTAPPDPRLGLAAAAGWPFLLTAFVARMPSSMVQLGYLMVLSQGGRGFAVAGLAVGAVGLGTAVGAPVVGRLVDRFGPFWVLLGATCLSLLGQGAFLAAFQRDAPSGALLACAAVVGAANPQVGPVARSHWSHLATRLHSPHLVQQALGYEGAVDEIGFVVGPVLAGVLVSALGAEAAAVAMIAFTVVLQGVFLAYLWFGATPADAHHVTPAGDDRVQASSLLPMLACLGVGTLFGATQTALTALFQLRGTPGITGVVYGCVGIGSGVASLLVGRIPQRIGVPTRVATGALAMLVGALLMMRLPGVLGAVPVTLLLGAGAGITLVSSFGWMERIAPRSRVATMMTVLATCLTLGVSVGATVAGRLAADPAHSMWPVLGSALLGGLAAAGMHLSVRRG